MTNSENLMKKMVFLANVNKFKWNECRKKNLFRRTGGILDDRWQRIKMRKSWTKKVKTDLNEIMG